MKAKIILLFLITIIVSCKNIKEEQSENIEKTLRTYMYEKAKQFDSTLKLDSIRIIKIDSASSKFELKDNILKLRDSLNNLFKDISFDQENLKLKVEQFKILKYMNSLSSSNDDLQVFKDDITKQSNKLKLALEKASKLENEIKKLKNILLKSKIDSTDFKFYNVKFKVCFTNKKLEQECEDSLNVNITKNYRIKK